MSVPAEQALQDQQDDNIDAYVESTMGPESYEAEHAPPTESVEPAATQDAPSAPSDSQSSGQQPTQEPGTGTAGQQQPASPTPSTSDAQGNLLNEQGQVVARAGAERRLYERAERQRHEMERLKGQVQYEQGRIKQYADLQRTMEEKGVSAQDLELGATMMRAMRNDPAGTAKWALQHAMSQGVELATIIGDQAAQGTMQMQAISAMLDERLGPLKRRQQEDERAAAEEAENERQYNQFVADHEYADLHDKEIAAIATANQHWSLDRCYYELKMYALQNGLDFTQPLGPQMNAPVQQASPQPVQQQTAPTPTQPGPSPSVSIPTGGAAPDNTRGVSDFADPSEDWSDIVKQSMREVGMEI